MNQRYSRPQQRASSQLPFGPTTALLGASALVLFGLTRRSKPGMALATAGGLLAVKAVRSQSSSPEDFRTTFLVNTSPQQAYDLWRDFENMPRFMAHLKSVRKLDDRHSEWVARGPLQKDVHWSAEITDDRPGQRIAWRSMPHSDVQTWGWVEFRPDPQNRGTFVSAEVQYNTPGGKLGRAFAALVGKHPDFMVREAVRRFKALVETGETPTTAGQTHGPRGVHGHTEQFLFRETSNHPRPQAA